MIRFFADRSYTKLHDPSQKLDLKAMQTVLSSKLNTENPDVVTNFWLAQKAKIWIVKTFKKARERSQGSVKVNYLKI